MDTRTEEQLSRWTAAALIDQATADRIRQYELSQRKPSGARWQVTLALAFGAILLAAGVALFVAAHWDALSPLSRFSIVISLVMGFHLAADLVRAKFNGLAIALHGVGTLAAGAAVLLIVIQVLLVSSIAGKFLYERKVCPRVWTRAAQVDPDSPLRGRYLVLPLGISRRSG